MKSVCPTMKLKYHRFGFNSWRIICKFKDNLRDWRSFLLIKFGWNLLNFFFFKNSKRHSRIKGSKVPPIEMEYWAWHVAASFQKLSKHPQPVAITKCAGVLLCKRNQFLFSYISRQHCLIRASPHVKPGLHLKVNDACGSEARQNIWYICILAFAEPARIDLP